VSVYDPIPEPLTGEPSVIAAKSRVLSRTAEALREAAQELRSLSSENVTISEAVDEIRTKGTEASGDIDRVEIRYQGAADAMSEYGTALSAAKTRAENARQRIIDNNSEAAYWRRREDSLRSQVLGGESSPELLEEITDVQRRVNRFEAEFVSAMAEYAAAESDKTDAVAAAMNALHTAAELAGINDGFWDRVGSVLEAAYEWAQEHLAPLIEKLRTILELLKSIVDILSFIVGILSIFLPFLAPLAAALTLVSLALAASILLCSLALVLLGRESIGRLLSDTIGLVTSVITSKMGGLKIFKPAEKLDGLGAVFTRAPWSNGANMVRFEFALGSAVMGRGETIATYGMDIAAKLFDPAKTTIKLAGGVAGGITKGGLGDMTLDFFPEGGSAGDFFNLEGGAWELNTDELIVGIGKPVAGTLSGGASGPVMSLVDSVNALRVSGS
jgi:hypothetical protein